MGRPATKIQRPETKSRRPVTKKGRPAIKSPVFPFSFGRSATKFPASGIWFYASGFSSERDETKFHLYRTKVGGYLIWFVLYRTASDKDGFSSDQERMKKGKHRNSSDQEETKIGSYLTQLGSYLFSFRAYLIQLGSLIFSVPGAL